MQTSRVGEQFLEYFAGVKTQKTYSLNLKNSDYCETTCELTSPPQTSEFYVTIEDSKLFIVTVYADSEFDSLHDRTFNLDFSCKPHESSNTLEDSLILTFINEVAQAYNSL